MEFRSVGIRYMRNIWVTVSKEGINKKREEMEENKIGRGDEYDVSFLGYPHRHTFHFKVWIEVFHDDRDIEFIQFKRWLENQYRDTILQLDYKSCEMIAEDLAKVINERYPLRWVRISVAEDNENGCEMEWEFGRVNG